MRVVNDDKRRHQDLEVVEVDEPLLRLGLGLDLRRFDARRLGARRLGVGRKRVILIRLVEVRDRVAERARRRAPPTRAFAGACVSARWACSLCGAWKKSERTVMMRSQRLRVMFEMSPPIPPGTQPTTNSTNMAAHNFESSGSRLKQGRQIPQHVGCGPTSSRSFPPAVATDVGGRRPPGT